MDVYIYRAALLCAEHGEEVRKELTAAGKAPADPSDESSYDSDEFPKGPYPNGGGEADGPQYCDDCGMFLENPLTDTADVVLRELTQPYDYPDNGDVASWALIADRAQDDGKPQLADAFRYYFAPGL